MFVAVRLTRTTDELAYIVCPPHTKRMSAAEWLRTMRKSFDINFWVSPPLSRAQQSRKQ